LRTFLICHDDAPLDGEGLRRWLGSFSTFTGTLVVREPRTRLLNRIRREIRRVGLLRFLDVIAFRIYYRFVHRAADQLWQARELERLRCLYPRSVDAPEVVVSSPNSREAEDFIRECRPDLVIARCKMLLNERIFSIPWLGTYVLHPGICPDYRNAHGCFWARARGDDRNIGATLLRIDRGIDTGPVFGYFRIDPPHHESHVISQHRAVFDHLDGIRDTLLAIAARSAAAIETKGRRSAVWGQPWLSAYVRMRLRDRRRAAAQRKLARHVGLKFEP
jgi:formyl transferase-like protein